MEDILDTNSFCFAFHHHLNNNEFHFNCFYDAIIQIDIVWNNYLVCVKFYHMESHVFHWFLIHNPLTHGHWMPSMLYSKKYLVIIIFGVVYIILVVILCLVIEMRNVTWFFIIVACLYVFTSWWISPLLDATPLRHHHLKVHFPSTLTSCALNMLSHIS